MSKSKNPKKKSKTGDTTAQTEAQTEVARKDYAQKSYPRRSKHFPMSGLYWVLFIGAVILWAVVFSSRFSEFDSYADQVEDQLATVSQFSSRAVLGIEDGESPEGGEETSQVPETETPVEKADSASVIEEIEEERKEALRDVLLLQLPYEIDNPNYPVTFVEPTEEGVEIQVDGDGFSKKKSPFVLPSLAIGKHTVNFRFTDTDEVKQNLEETVIVIPRAPVWDDDQITEFRSDEKVKLSGTALPRSTVVMVVGNQLITESVDTDEEGAWSITVSEDIGTGEHIAGGYVRKEGYASNFSDPLQFTVGYVEGVTSEVGDDDAGASAGTTSSQWWENYMDEDNYYLVFVGAGVAIILLILFVALIVKMFKGGRKDEAGWVEDLKNGNDPKQGSEKVSLRDKFAQAGLDVRRIGKKSVGKDEKSGEVEEGTEPKKEEDDVKKEDEKKKEEIPQKEEDEEKKEKKEKKEKPKIEEKEEPEKEDKEPKSEPKKEEEKEGPPEDTSENSTEDKKVYSKDEFMEKFKDGEGTMGKETKKIKISLTSSR